VKDTLTQGQTYNFRVESRNAVGYSLLSEPIAIVAAIGPSQPPAPTTSVVVNDVIISWTVPVTDNGSPITSYKIFIQQSDEVSYSMETTHCDGADPTIFFSMYCAVPFTSLTVAPFNLQPGVDIYAKIVATNQIGDSVASEPGNGAQLIISTVPDAPVQLARDSVTTTTSQIGLLWNAGASDGGQPLLDFRIWYDQGIGANVILASNVNNQPYVVGDLTMGTTYAFQVEARNAVGYSSKSQVFEIIAATVPDAPTTPTTSILNNDITIDWSQPAENG
jgi:hypothetical protein